MSQILRCFVAKVIYVAILPFLVSFYSKFWKFMLLFGIFPLTIWFFSAFYNVLLRIRLVVIYALFGSNLACVKKLSFCISGVSKSYCPPYFRKWYTNAQWRIYLIESGWDNQVFLGLNKLLFIICVHLFSNLEIILLNVYSSYKISAHALEVSILTVLLLFIRPLKRASKLSGMKNKATSAHWKVRGSHSHFNQLRNARLNIGHICACWSISRNFFRPSNLCFAF